MWIKKYFNNKNLVATLIFHCINPILFHCKHIFNQFYHEMLNSILFKWFLVIVYQKQIRQNMINKSLFLMPTIMHRPLPFEKQFLLFIIRSACTGSISCMFNFPSYIVSCIEVVWQNPAKLFPWLLLLWRLWQNLPTTFLLT